MAKYYGVVGFAEPVETAPGVWDYDSNIIEKYYTGDTVRYTSRNNAQAKVTDDVTINHELSILLDPYAYHNYQHIRFAVLNGTAWKVTSVTVAYPRINLSLGEVYNGPRSGD